ncbi:MAG: D-aminoacylase [Actinomycetota bacterium]|nr:D-aminoacylase [Actinomycetota bacterium]
MFSHVMDLLLTGGLVYDGTGAAPSLRDISIVDGRLVLDAADGAAAGAVTEARDVSGLAICPGFVDIHTHSDLTLLSNPLGNSKIRQGVTTEVVGNCGLGLAPLPAADAGSAADIESIRAAVGYLDLDPAITVSWHTFGEYLQALDAARPAINVAAFAAHLPLHAQVVGLHDRPADAEQILAMVALLEESLAAGAVGLSTGLVYAPLCYVGEDELLALGTAVAKWDRLFAWHVRDYGDDLIPSVQQAVRVARATGCRLQISHLTAVGRRNWGAVSRALAEVDAARADGCDIGVDIYPYLAGNAPLSQLLPDWAQEGGSAVFAPRLRDPAVRARITAGWATRHWDWADIVVDTHSIADIAAASARTPEDAMLDLLAEHGGAVFMVAFGRSDDDLRVVLGHQATVVASDGQALDPAGPTGMSGTPHPRSYGCFPRYLAHYAADLADGIRRCTSAPADRVGLFDRGRIAGGLPADLVIFDPATLTDTATFAAPQQFPVGIAAVLVGGRTVIDHQLDTGARLGTIIRKEQR